jgi:serine/threonine-protein kinase
MPQGEDAELTRTPAASDLPTEVSSPHLWGDFRLIGELGRGGFGRVYHAWDPTLTRDIALKVVRLPDATEAATALHEGRMLARVRHRNVVTVYGALQIGDEVGVWMELIRGRHLSQVIREQGPMGAEEATVVGISLCQALAAVHAAGLLHRDIKANNVMRESGGRIVLMDFGTGRENESTLAADLAGTPVYMAPEILDGGPASVQSDLYSLGVLLYYIVTGQYPVAGRSLLELSLAHRRGERQHLADRRPDLPEGFIRAVERALSQEPAGRPASAGTLMRDLTNALPSAVGPDVRGPDGARPDPWTPSTVPPHTPGSTTPATLMAPSPVGRWVGTVAVSALLIGVLGLLTTAGFNLSLERTSVFSTDGVVDWWIFGIRSLVWPAVLCTVVVIAGRLAITVWRGILHVVPALRRLVGAVSGQVRSTVKHLGITGPAGASQWLVLLQVVALALVWRRFIPLIEAVTYPGSVDAGRLGLLSSTSLEPVYFQSAAALLVFGMGLAWYRLLAAPGGPEGVHWSTRVAGAAVLLIAILMLVIPYRLLYHNEMPRVQLGEERCYRLGAHDGQVLLYCPDRTPPRVTTADENVVVMTGITENIFTPGSPVR